MFDSIYIKDFRNLIEINIIPSTFINLIEGENGQGKSSILEAIKYLLTDELNEKISEYVRWGCDKFIIKCKFSFAGDKFEYNIEGSKTAKKELIINGIETYKNSEATKKLNELINTNIIKYSVIAEQGKNTQILFDTPANRLKHLKEILGVDKLIPILEEMKEEIKGLEATVSNYKKEIEVLSNREYLFLDVPEVDDIEDLKIEFSELYREKSLYEALIIIYDTYTRDLDVYLKAIEKIDKNTKLIDANNFSIQEKLSGKILLSGVALESLQENLIQLERDKTQQKNNIDKYSKIKNQIDQITEFKQGYEKDLEKYPIRRIGACKYTEEELKKESDKLNGEKSNLLLIQRDLNLAIEGKCPTCGKEYKSDIESLTQLKEKTVTDCATLDILITKMRNEIDSYNKAILEQEKNKAQRGLIQKEIDRYDEQLSQLNIEYGSYDSSSIIDYDVQILQVKNEIKRILDAQDINSKIDKEVNELENNNKVLVQLNADCLQIKKPDDMVEPKSYDKERFSFLQKEINIYEQKISERDKALEYNAKIENEKKIDSDRIKFLSSEIDSIYYNIGIIKESRQILDKEFSAYLIDKGTVFIKEKMADFFSKAYNKYEISFSQDKNSIDFFYGEEGGQLSPVSMASGFERSLLALSFRVALASLQDLGIFILDEVDSDASVSNSMLFYETLINNLTDSQIFSITHCEDTKEYILQQKGSKSFILNNGEIIN